MKKYFNKLLTLTICTLMAYLMSAQAIGVGLYKDYESHWAKNTIQSALNSGISRGYPDGSYKPNSFISRVEFFTIVNNAYQFKSISSTSFNDVEKNSWYASAVAIAKSAGYVSGYPDGGIHPNSSITRQEIAVIISRLKPLKTQSNTLPFTDVAAVSNWGKQAIIAAYEAKIMIGYLDGSFKPESAITRAEALVAVMNCVNYKTKNPVIAAIPTQVPMPTSGPIMVITPTITVASTDAAVVSPTKTPIKTEITAPPVTKTSAPASGSKIDNKTQLFNLAWSNSDNHEKTSVSANGNNNIVLLDCDVDASKIAQYKQQGYKVAGYISVGSYEDWRNDKANFPSSVFGAPYDGWKGETWFLVSKWKDLIPGMTKRMNMLKNKGFELVEFDNIEFATGNKSDMIEYALELANVANANSLSPLFKNASELIKQDSRIKDAYSGFIIEEAFEFNDISTFATVSDKPTWFFEYKSVDSSKIQSWMTNVWYDSSSGWQKFK